MYEKNEQLVKYGEQWDYELQCALDILILNIPPGQASLKTAILSRTLVIDSITLQ